MCLHARFGERHFDITAILRSLRNAPRRGNLCPLLQGRCRTEKLIVNPELRYAPRQQPIDKRSQEGRGAVSPKPSIIVAPVMFSNFSQTSIGNGAEAEKQELTLVRSILSTLGQLLMALNIWLIDTVVPEDRRGTVGEHCSTETEPVIRVDVVCPQLWSLTNAAT